MPNEDHRRTFAMLKEASEALSSMQTSHDRSDDRKGVEKKSGEKGYGKSGRSEIDKKDHGGSKTYTSTS